MGARAAGASTLALLAARSAHARTRRSLDFAWRFHLGDPAGQEVCPGGADDPFEPMNDT
eukprot:gene18808-1460_t